MDYDSFRKAILQYRIDVPEVDIKNAYKAFDLTKDGRVEYDEVMKVIIGPMNKYRTTIVEKAFDKIDLHQQGLIEVDSLISKYDSKNHPDVRAGKRDSYQAKLEFRDTF